MEKIIMNLKILRKLAKSVKFQSIYRRAKESGMIKIFYNDFNLSKIQEWFLYYLEVYSMLYQDLANKELYISEDVINNDLRCDAYLFMKSKIKDKKDPKKKETTTSSKIPSIIFRRK